MKRKALGRGLESIIKNRRLNEDGDLMEIQISDIKPNPYQPRKTFDEEKIRELARSIDQSGLIQPIVVFKKEDRYFIGVGERRWRAFQYLKRTTIPAYIKPFNRDEMVIHGLVENIQREDLNAIEVAEGLAHLLEMSGLTQEKVSEKVGMNRTTLTNYLRLLQLPPKVKDAVAGREISPGHARALLTLGSPEQMLDGYRQIKDKRLTVRQVENMVKGVGQSKKSPAPSEPVQADPDILKMETRLARCLSTKVKLKYHDGKGKVEIFFSQLEEFERLFQILLRGDQR